MDARDAEHQARAARLLHAHDGERARGEAIAPTLVSASTFHLPGSPEAPDTYGRAGNPGWRETESLLAILEDAPCLLFPSGMAAIAAALHATLQTGDTVLLPSDGYYMTRRYVERELGPLGIGQLTMPTPALGTASLDGVAVALIESPSNPMLDIVDLADFARRCHDAGTVLIVDNTTCTAALQRPLDLGADIVVTADTKAAGGHADLLLGHVATRDEARLERIRDWRTASGAIPGALETWLLHRGLQTLEIRLERMCESATALAEGLADHPAVRAPRYPGLAAHPGHDIASRQMRRFGSLLGFELADADRAERFIIGCPLLDACTSFGSTHSSAERRARWGDPVPEGFVRLSVGCEPTAVLLEQVLEALDRSA